MKFYTNVQLIGNQFLVRGVENGRRYETRDDFRPTLFVKSKRDTKYKTLTGEPVEPIQPGNVRDCRNFYKKYEDIDGFDIYGNDRYIYQYISEKYPQDAPGKMRELSQEYGFNFPYLHDETQKVAISFSAACTPDFFLFNENLKLYYRGRYDDSRPGSEESVTGADLLNATKSLLDKKSPPKTQLPSIGCNIKWKPGQEPSYFKG